MFVAALAVPVAENVSGEPESVPLVAVRVFGPAMGPSVHDPTVAMPAVVVVALAPVIDPPPDATANVTATPATGLPLTSVTFTDGGGDTSVPTVEL